MVKEGPILDYNKFLRTKNALNNTFDVREGGILVVDPTAAGELTFELERRTFTETPAQAAGIIHIDKDFQRLTTPDQLPPSQYQEAITVFEDLKDPGKE